MSNMLVTGATGQLGKELCNLLEQERIPYFPIGSKDLDITDSIAVFNYIEEKQPKYIIHCAAFTAVDNAEDEGKEDNWRVNADGTEYIAKAAEKIGATLIYISTDYVFDGEKTEEYLEGDQVNPKNEYGKAKLFGERAVKKYCEKYYIVRTSWVFGEYGKNFVLTMLKLAKTHKKLTIVSDQYGRPTWTKTIAEFIIHLYNLEPEYGIYHLSNDDSCSWFEFASAILVDKEIEIHPVTSEQYPQKADRPRHSIMSLEKVKKTGFSIISWQESLSKFISELK